MYCPNCGQQQVSEEMKFCSRCGLSFTGLAEWLAGDGVPVQPKQETKVAVDSRRRKGMRRGAKLMFFSVALFPIFLMISIVEDKPEPLIFPTMMFFVSLALVLYARLFSDNTAAPAKIQAAAQTSTLKSTSARSSLPPAREVVMPVVGRQQVRTNELAQPPSVTEHTTKLLDNE